MNQKDINEILTFKDLYATVIPKLQEFAVEYFQERDKILKEILNTRNFSTEFWERKNLPEQFDFSTIEDDEICFIVWDYQEDNYVSIPVEHIINSNWRDLLREEFIAQKIAKEEKARKDQEDIEHMWKTKEIETYKRLKAIYGDQDV